MHPSRLARLSTAPSSGQALRSIPTGLIPPPIPDPMRFSPEPTLPVGPCSPRCQNAPKHSASGRGRARKLPDPGRGTVCLTSHEPSTTLPLGEKGRLKFRSLSNGSRRMTSKVGAVFEANTPIPSVYNYLKGEIVTVRKSAFLMLAVILLAAVPCMSQSLVSGGLFSGRVTDQSDKPVAQARVEVNGKETSAKTTARSSCRCVPKDELYPQHFARRFRRLRIHLPHELSKDRPGRWFGPRSKPSMRRIRSRSQDKPPGVDGEGNRRRHLYAPADSLVDARGNPPTGPLRAAIATLDVANGEAPGDWAVRSDDGQAGRLPGLLRGRLRPVHRPPRERCGINCARA